MANATLPEITKALGDNIWMLEHLSEDECAKLGADLEGFTKAIRKATYSTITVLGVTGDAAKDMIINQVKLYLNSTTTPVVTPTSP